MTDLVSWIATVLVVALLITFAAALRSLRLLPTDGRPRTPTYDRFGAQLGLAENPDYHESPGEEHTDAIGLSPASGGKAGDNPDE
jgi:hypothetical protein